MIDDVSDPANIGLDVWDRLRSSLSPEFARLYDTVIRELLNEGVVMRPYSGLRSPLEQAVLWCQSRTPLEAELIARRLQEDGARYLAQVIRRAMIISVPGRWATNNLPGQSWHNFGLACDAHAVSEDGRAVWGPKHASYESYARLARAQGLFPGFDLARQDVVHVQAVAGPVRALRGPWSQVDRELERLFPHDAG